MKNVCQHCIHFMAGYVMKVSILVSNINHGGLKDSSFKVCHKAYASSYLQFEEMKIIVFKIFVLTFILTSCVDSSIQKIEGDWVGYKSIRYTNNDSIINNLHFIISFEGDSVCVRNYKYIEDGNRDSIRSSSYILFDSIIILGFDSLKVEYLDQNKLILSRNNIKYLHFRISKGNQNFNNKLTGNIYVISDSSSLNDTVEFIDDNTVFISNLYLEEPKTSRNWRIRNFRGNSFLIIDDQEIPVFMIEKINKNDFILKTDSYSDKTWKMKKIKKTAGNTG